MKKILFLLFIFMSSICIVGCESETNQGDPSSPDPIVDPVIPPVKEYSEGLEYELSADGTYYIIVGIGTCTDELLNIKNTYQDKEVKAIKEEAFIAENIKSVKVPETIEIGKGAFKNCNELTDIQMGKIYGGYLGYIFGGNQASSNAQVVPASLKNVVILDETEIIDKAFTGCSNLEFIDLNDEIETIGDNVFYNCEKLKNLTFPIEITEVHEKTFYNCFGLENIYYDGSIATWIGIKFPCMESNPMYYAKNFYLNGSLLEELTISEGITSIGDYQFVGFKNVKKVNINSDITSIGTCAFLDMVSNEEFVITNNEKYQTIDGVLFNGNILICYPIGNTDKAYIIKNNIEEIKEYAFYHAVNLENITFEETSVVSSIGKAGFAQCTNLKEITIPATVTTISDELLIGNTNIKVINLPKTITYIGVSAFESCTTIEKIIIPIAVTTLREYAFRHCENLTIYCEIDKAPKGWTSSYWNVYPARPVVWSYTEE